jgi:hypothetical protein
MIRDTFYQDIIQGLSGRLDPELFEQCASDLLRNIYSGLVPIRGGSDAGMDGAISDVEGVAFPLVTTTQEDVIGNLTKNLNSYLQSGGTRRKIVLATSQELTPKRRRNLEERASELGFTLIQVYPQEALADLLYRSPEWCLELLGLTGQPPALSVIPFTSRPQIVELLIGRERDLDWIRSTDGDLLLVGQPGSGKTFLMYTFVKQNEGLFLINNDPTLVAQSIRAQNPNAIIIDDAHIDISRLNILRQLRTQIGAGFRIIATCWPGHKDNILYNMQIPTSSARELEPLTRDQIVELIKSTGIAGPVELIRELVNQAEGRPGLAATLCHLCLKGDVRQIALGDALSRDIRTTFEPLLGKEATAIIAAFSLGGDKGMSMETVATQYELSLVNVQQIATGLAAGGVLTDVGQNRLAVRPPSLRYALIRDVFFCGATSFPYSELVNQSPDVAETALTLIGTRAHGAAVPNNLLIEMVNRADSDKVWEHYSYLGPNESNWLLENRPDKLIIVADAALNFTPQQAIPLLLNHAIDDNRPLHSHPDHPIRKIEGWVKSGEPGSNQATTRRGILLDSALSWFAETNNANIALKAIRFVLSPSFADTETSPGSQLTVTFRTGLVTQSDMLTIRGFWPRIKEFLQIASIQDWRPMFDLIHEWLYPGRVAQNVSEEIGDSMQDFAGEIAKDIAATNVYHPGVLSHISRIFKQFELPLTIGLDPEFDILFPVEEWGTDYKKIQAKQATVAKKLAVNWSSQDAKNVAERIARYELEASAAGLTWPRWSPFVAETIASKAQSPSIWARAFIEAGTDSDLVIPFLRAAASIADPEYSELLKVCLGKSRLHFAGISVGLTAPILSKDILPKIMSTLDDRFSNWIELECMRLHIPDDRLAALLAHPDRSVAAAAAIGEWEASPKGTVRESVKDIWKVAVINGLERQYQGEEIFRKDPSLAFSWLQLRMKEKRGFSHCSDELRNVALQVISLEQRKNLLEQIGDSFGDSEIIHGIVDDETQVYCSLLENKRLKRFHLSPLAGKPNSVWISKALLALDFGYSTSEVSHAVYGQFRFWSGNESTYWAQWFESFEPLLTHDDPRIRTIGKIGQDYALAQKEWALAKERHEDIYGRWQRE